MIQITTWLENGRNSLPQDIINDVTAPDQNHRPVNLFFKVSIAPLFDFQAYFYCDAALTEKRAKVVVVKEEFFPWSL